MGFRRKAQPSIRKLVETLYCPDGTCDKPFPGAVSRVEGLSQVRAHVRRAHPERAVELLEQLE